MKKFFESIMDIVEDIRCEIEWGSSFRFIVANLILGEELRRTVSFSRLDIENAIRYMDIDPEFAKRRLKKVYKDLSILGEFENTEVKE